MADDTASLKKDIDMLGERLREAESKLYDRITLTDKSQYELSGSVKLMFEKLTTFIETFKNHDQNEMNKYDEILKMFKESKDEFKKLEDKISQEYVTKKEINKFERQLEETNKTVKQGLKIFYIGTGIFITLVTFGSLIMYILNLISKLQSMGVN